MRLGWQNALLALLALFPAPLHAGALESQAAPDAASLAAIRQAHRQWVVALRADAGAPANSGGAGQFTSRGPAAQTQPAGAGPAAQPVGAGRAVPLSARLASRLSALGLSAVRNLADLPGGLDLGRALEARARALRSTSPGAGLAPPGGATERAFGLDPARIWLIEAADSAAGAAAMAELRADPEIEWLEPNATRSVQGWLERDVTARGGTGVSGATMVAPGTVRPSPHRASVVTTGLPGIPPFPDDPLFRWGQQWALFNLGPPAPYGGTPRADIHVAEGWAITTGRDDVILSVADTGTDPDQPELGGILADGRPRMFGAVNLSGMDPPDSIFDRRGHGTVTSGVMAARTNNGVSIDTLGMAGVCGGDGVTNSGCRLVPIKVTVGTTEDATEFGLAQAILYAAATGARAMNLSIAGTESSTLERLALYDAITHGCVISAAAGNAGTQAYPFYPSAYAIDGLCIEVGATDVNDARSLFSSFGPWLDVMAPGENVYGTFMTYPNAFGGMPPGFVAGSGTSVSAPLVAGAVGLLAALRPELIENDFQRVIRESAHDLGAPGADTTFGWGRLDVGAALAAVPAGVGIWHGAIAGALGNLIATDSLVIADSSQAAGGPPPRVWANAKEYEVTATVAIPDSFSGAVRIWPRVGGTSTVRGGFRLAYFAPWAEVASQSARSFTLRGYIYQSGDTCAGCDAFVPVPVSDLTFGFTVMGPVSHGSPPPWNGGPPPLAIAPNPAVGQARIASVPGATVTILDLSGRLVRKAQVDPVTGIWSWDGLDSSGRRVRAGVYLVRTSAAGQTRDGKLVLLR